MLKALQQAHLHLRKKKKKSPVSYAKMREEFRAEIERIAIKLELARKNNLNKEDYHVLRGRILALREMRVKLGLGAYAYVNELWKGVSD